MTQATPGARKLATELNVDLETIEGTGKSGYVLEQDVRRVASLDATNGKGPLPPFPHGEIHEAFEGEALPVSDLYKLRFRQDDGEGNLVGEDLLAIRPKAVGGRFRSSEGILGWFVADRGFFQESTPGGLPPGEPEPESKPESTPLLAGVDEPSGFAVSE
jgi:hypothetical protein